MNDLRPHQARSPDEVHPEDHKTLTGIGADLFGRRMLYAVVWSLQLVTGAVVSPLLAYTLAPDQFGLVASALALHQLLNVLTVFGLDQAITVQNAEDGHSESGRGLLTTGIATTTLSSLVLGFTAVLWGPALGFGGHASLVLAVVLWTAPGAAVQMMLALLSSQDRLRSFGILCILGTVGAQFCGFGLLLLGHKSATTYAWGLVASQYLAMVIGLLVARPRLAGLLDIRTSIRAVRFGMVLTLSSLSGFVLNAGDRVIIQRQRGPTETGRYQIAYTVGYVVVFLIMFTTQAWTPQIAAIRNEAHRLYMVAVSRDLVYRLLGPSILGITLATPVVLRIVAPSEYRPSSLLIVVYFVALSAFPVAASGATRLALISARRARPLALAAAAAAIFNIGMNLALVPWLSITGSAIATVLAFGAQVLIQRFALRRSQRIRRSPRMLTVESLFLCGIGALSTLLPQTTTLNVVRLGVALACLPWVWIRLQKARKLPLGNTNLGQDTGRLEPIPGAS